MKLHRLSWLVLAMIVDCVCGHAEASTSGPYTDSIPSTSANWTLPLDYPQFDPSLGTLTKVSFALGGDLSALLTAHNLGGGASNGNSVAEMLYSIEDPNSLLTGTPQLIIIQSPPILNYTLQSGESISGNRSGSNTSNASYTAVSILLGFSGTGTISLSASAVAQPLIANSGAPTTISQVSSADLTAALTYTYTPGGPPVPEPGSLMLLAIGAAGLLLWARRRAA